MSEEIKIFHVSADVVDTFGAAQYMAINQGFRLFIPNRFDYKEHPVILRQYSYDLNAYEKAPSNNVPFVGRKVKAEEIE